MVRHFARMDTSERRTEDTAQHPVLRKVLIDLSIMVVLGVVLAVMGPFGSFQMPLSVRLLYWVGLAVTGYACFRPIGALVTSLGPRLDLPEWPLWIAACLLASVPVTLAVFWAGQLPGPFSLPSFDNFARTYPYVLLVGSGVTVLFHQIERRKAVPMTGDLRRPSEPQVETPPAPEARFLDRLPAHLGSDLLALEMEDHYVRVHTALGSELILLRMRDAVAELGGVEGAQVHRSWWVARDAVEDVKRDGRNLRLVLTGGLEAPVSRARVAELKDAGWL
ncbi:LytTR family transcriptional regulator DNA-binding domain-containing protein [Erythrobacter sp. YJ-T3-07]|uniref:LytTR family DNA-binding domain-containing protein n=1 Tax=Erythrobacter sp. YJ-T3-07 TaxID=2793063 RepID=UPI0018D4020E|nr:LytTR family DNA-binding domain-containing protein [Erythrobacter sp. YJ-T3-07]MBH1942619.1 LytTR family transcriptional regulator DNA-binding domain-containing protein [Erythrobacter sp. YJ-T3-07]